MTSIKLTALTDPRYLKKTRALWREN